MPKWIRDIQHTYAMVIRALPPNKRINYFKFVPRKRFRQKNKRCLSLVLHLQLLKIANAKEYLFLSSGEMTEDEKKEG